MRNQYHANDQMEEARRAYMASILRYIGNKTTSRLFCHPFCSLGALGGALGPLGRPVRPRAAVLEAARPPLVGPCWPWLALSALRGASAGFSGALGSPLGVLGGFVGAPLGPPFMCLASSHASIH